MKINQYKNGQHHGYWEHYYSSGNVFAKGNYILGNRIGWWTHYDSNGAIWYEGEYNDNGRRIGYWSFYDNSTPIKLKKISFYLQ